MVIMWWNVCKWTSFIINQTLMSWFALCIFNGIRRKNSIATPITIDCEKMSKKGEEEDEKETSVLKLTTQSKISLFSC